MGKGDGPRADHANDSLQLGDRQPCRHLDYSANDFCWEGFQNEKQAAPMNNDGSTLLRSLDLTKGLVSSSGSTRPDHTLRQVFPPPSDQSTAPGSALRTRRRWPRRRAPAGPARCTARSSDRSRASSSGASRFRPGATGWGVRRARRTLRWRVFSAERTEPNQGSAAMSFKYPACTPCPSVIEAAAHLSRNSPNALSPNHIPRLLHG